MQKLWKFTPLKYLEQANLIVKLLVMLDPYLNYIIGNFIHCYYPARVLSIESIVFLIRLNDTIKKYFF